ncbi:MAG: aminomethyl-transferring glycine dehydrogenase [Planctomycetota bacterium]
MVTSSFSEFSTRHIGPSGRDEVAMLKEIGVNSLDELMAQTVPSAIRMNKPLRTPAPETEAQYLSRLRTVAAKNRIFRSAIGMGYYDTHTPNVILRNVLENPGWYTPYTPYQAEIAQGRLEALLNYQTMVSDLTGLPIANASLLDEGTAAAEAMMMLRRLHKEDDRRVFLASDRLWPQTLDVLKSRAEPQGITLRICDLNKAEFGPEVYGLITGYPDGEGAVTDIGPLVKRAKAAGVLTAVCTDLLALCLITPPGEFGADVALGNSQRFGVPMGFGGPHAAFFATREEYVREMPGRIIGVSIDRFKNQAYRMTLQTREQHIRREKAKSNICTAQALLANMAGFYAAWHGPAGLKAIALRVHGYTRALEAQLKKLKLKQANAGYFDTLKILADKKTQKKWIQRAEKLGYNLRAFADGAVGISLDETTTEADVAALASVFSGKAAKVGAIKVDGKLQVVPSCVRTSAYLTHPVFNSHHTETQMMRYLRKLEGRDVGLNVSMIALGSCTMKLNAVAEMIPVTWAEFAKLHPFAPSSQTKGYAEITSELEKYLCEITGFAAVSLQPNSGAQGEYAGLMTIHAYHKAKGQGRRNITLIPSSAHGTNPASAVMAGLEVVVVDCKDDGTIDLNDLKAKCAEHKENLSCIMVTYPSTYGVFEEGIQEICKIVHAHGGQVYMDGANMNAQVGLTSPALIGADVCHLNLHKTFAIPHGGGGPGMGPIGVAKHLAPFLPSHAVVKTGGAKGVHAVSAAPWGSAAILLISYGYIRLLGPEGMTRSTKAAILNANYIRARLEKHYSVLYANSKGRVAHEMIFDLRPFKKGTTLEEGDVAKRLMDYGFHAPTVSWPVPGTMMVEPTESEPKEELDRFCDALIAIHHEMQEVVEGKADPKDNLLKNAPHPVHEIAAETWSHPYSRERAVFPLPFVKGNKFWPAVGRIDNPHGDRNLVCACPAVEAYASGSSGSAKA